MLGGQTFATLSLVLPILDGLAKGLSVGANDSASCIAVKNQLRVELVAKFNLEAVQTTTLAVVCAAVGPRFQHLPFVQSEDDRERAKKDVLEELQCRHQQLQHQQEKSQEMGKQSALQLSVKRKVPVDDPLVQLASSAKREAVKVEKESASALSFILGEEEEELEEDLEMEVAMYFTEKPSRR